MKLLSGAFFGTGVISGVFLYAYINNYIVTNTYEGVLEPLSFDIVIEPICWICFIIISFALSFSCYKR